MIIDGFTFEGVTPGEFLGKYRTTILLNGAQIVEDYYTMSDISDKILTVSSIQWPSEEIIFRIEKPVHLTGKFFKRGLTLDAEENRETF